ncbi:hypothetical protein [Pseudanabaena mucicola]|uniref:hypothetical protein n=1 Tax=Pseudanabaena mucicola TaxID=71190 RepID=UPI0025766B9D|nr:hypothetical protein [Pseudanabaena mucicola]
MANRIRRERGTTISELRWPIEKAEFAEISDKWTPKLVVKSFELVWSAYDLLKTDILTKIDCTKASKQIEKNINSLLQLRISRLMTGYEPFDVQHEVPEFETSLSDKAQPPSYDIAFILRSNERIILPLEAKVLKTDKAISKYINEVKSNFLTCRYSPFSSQAGMLGYCLGNNSQETFNNISTALPCNLSDHPNFMDRDHKISDHQRNVPVGKTYPVEFRCHHLLLQLSKEPNVKQASRKRKSQKN